MTQELRTCRRCEAVLKEYATGGLCPRCLLRGGLGEADALGFDAEAQAAMVLTGRRFGDYDLLEEIAHGGMGVVYKARQRSLNRVVAVKVLLAGQFAEPEFVQRFRAEAEAAARLQHPNIVAIHEIGEQEGYQYFSMDYVEGKNLAQIRHELGTPGVNFQRCALWVRTMAEAVHYAHQRGIIHRDLKPANILVDAQDQPHITDFGLAKRFLETTDLTVTGQVLGSPNYLPPEQAAGKPAGPAGDVYSLGAILYHLLTGRPPFEGETLTGVLKQVLEAEPVSPRLLNPSIPRDLATMAQKCLEKEPSRRYASAQALADELGRFLAGEPIRSRPVGVVGQAWKWCRRQPVRAGLLGALLLVLILGTTGIAWQWRRAERERDMSLRHAYAGDMKVALLSLEEGNLGGALRLLNKYRPMGKAGGGDRNAQTDLRGWEWRYLWGLCRSDERLKIIEQRQPFANLALSPDGQVLALRQAEGNFELWDWKGGRHLGTLTNRGWPKAMGFCPDGKLIASANLDPRGKPVVSFWDLATRKIVRDLPQPFAVTSLALSPDGKLLCTYHSDQFCRLWHLPTGALITNFVAGEAINSNMRISVFSSDGKRLFLTHYSGLEQAGELTGIDLETGTRWHTAATEPGNSVTALAVSPDGQLLATGNGYSDARIYLWDARTGSRVGRLEGHHEWITKLVFSRDGQTLYSGSADQSIRAWSVQNQREVHRWRGHTGVVSGLALTPDGKALLSCARDGSARAWDPEGPKRPPEYVALPVPVGPYGSPITPDSRRLITASASAPVTIWDMATGREVESIKALGTNHLCVALSPDERWLAAGSRDGVVQVWDFRERRCVTRFPASSNSLPVYGLQFLAPNNTLLSAGVMPHQVTELRCWEAGTWRELPFGPASVRLCMGWAQSPDGRRLALSSEVGPLAVWNFALGRVERTLGNIGGFVPAFSPDGRLLATSESRARIWEVDSGREIAVLEPQVNAVISVAFSKDGKRLVTGSDVGGDLQPAVEIWDYVAQRSLLSLRSQGRFTTWLGFSPDGNTLLTLSWHGQAELWHAPSWAEIEAAEEPVKTDR